MAWMASRIFSSRGACPPVISTASWGYLRLRRDDYTPGEVARWRAEVGAQPWSVAYVFFKHEDEARGPRFAVALATLLWCTH